MNIDYPRTAHIPQLRRLWQTAFGDDDAFLDLFFTHAFSPARCRCVIQGDTVCAAIYWFDCACEGAKFAYLYAAATYPSYRRRGLCRALMAEVRELLTAQGYAGLLLVPQDDALRAMYCSFGYRNCTTVSEFTAPAEDTPLSLRRLNTAEYAAARRALLPRGGVVQEGENLAFLSAFAHFFAGNGWLAAVTMEGSRLLCHELLGDVDAAYALVSALGCTEGHFRIQGTDKPFAQYLPLTPDCPMPTYFGLAFD